MPDVFVAPEEEKKKEPQKPARKVLITPDLQTKEQNRLHLFSTFCEFPEGVEFQNQENNEIIHLFIRRHFITNFRWVSLGALLMLTPLLFLILIPFFDSFLFPLPRTYILILLLFHYLIAFGYIFVNFIIWFYNIGFVTNLRVVDIDTSHINHKNIASTGIGDIVDVEYSQTGFFSGIFHYGNVNMQTEGIKPNFEFHGVPDPAKVADIISDLVRGRRGNE